MSDLFHFFGDNFRTLLRSKRCASKCALLFAMCAALIPALTLQAEPLTNSSIQEKEQQIQEAKQAQEEAQENVDALEVQKASLETDKQTLEATVTELDAQLTQLQTELDDLAQQIAAKEEEITRTTAQLAQAQNRQKEQYEALKKRIQFMYEKGENSRIGVLLNQKSFSRMLNAARYIEEVSEYDQEKLQEFKDQADLIRQTKISLENQQQELEDEKADVEERKTSMQNLVAQKQSEISGMLASIAQKEGAIGAYEQEIADQDDAIETLEAAIARERSVLEEQERRRREQAAASVVYYTGGQFSWPCPGYTGISSEYGYRVHPIYGTTKFHSGLDMAANYGTPILAAYSGTVAAASYDWSMGNYVMIDHGNGLYTVYMHASALYVSQGQEVSEGQQIAAVGSTGSSTGPHLHFSVRQNGQYVDPNPYLGR